MRRSGLLSRKFVIGILVWTTLLITDLEALRGSAVVLQAKTKVAEHKSETTDQNNNSPAANVTKSQLTGIPQIDYVLDPNLPRELNGQNLTDYPFYNAIPEEIDFKCDGLHDGFYASVPHKCQVYHHCLFGTRFDFLCANYTAFDQKTFICHFVSEVDCDNSPKYYKRNEALYKEATTATTTTTTTPAPSTTTANPLPPANGGGIRHGSPGRRRRPYRRRRPMYEYYYDDEEYADSDYYDEDVASLSHRRTPYRKHNKDNYGNENHDPEGDYDTHTEQVKPSTRTNNGGPTSVYDRPRAPPKVRRPVPKSERDKYDYNSKQGPVASASTPTTTTTEKPTTSNNKPKLAPAQNADDEYYDDEEEYDYEEPKPNAKPKQQMDYDFPTGFEETRRHTNRYRSRMPSRKRTEMVYDDYDVKERPAPSRINRRKEYNGRYDNERPRNIRPAPGHRNKNLRHEDEPHKYGQGGGYKKRVMDGEYRSRRVQEPKRPAYDDYYYEDEEEEMPAKRNRRPQKPKVNTSKGSISQTKYEQPPEEDDKPLESSSKYNKGFVANNQRNAKTNTLESEVSKSPSYNEISTTENIEETYSTTGHNQKYPHVVKTVKIVNNSLKDESDEIADSSVHTARESTTSSIQPKPTLVEINTPRYANAVSLKNITPHSPKSSADYYSTSPDTVKKEKKFPDNDDYRPLNKTVTPVRHFVITTPIRKPSHFGSLSTTTINSYREDMPYKISDKPQKLPEQVPKQPVISNEYYKPVQYIKLPSTMYNQTPSEYSGVHFRNFIIPVSSEQSVKLSNTNLKPIKEEHLTPENLNTISNGINNYHTNGFTSDTKPFVNDPSKPTSPNVPSQNYRQEHRLYNNGERLYTTNAITFPQQPPSNYDITAPGPSAPAEEPTAPEKKYSEQPTYTANADYDVTYNDALQPSTLHPIRRYPSGTFFLQNQPRTIAQGRLPVEYAFNESAFNSLGRSQNHY